MRLMRYLILYFTLVSLPALANADYTRCRDANGTSAQCAAYLPQCVQGQNNTQCQLAIGGAEALRTSQQHKQQRKK